MKETKEIKRGRSAVERNVKKSEKTHKEKKAEMISNNHMESKLRK
jgi:hypothetical protein